MGKERLQKKQDSSIAPEGKQSVQTKSFNPPDSGINFTVQKKENKTGLPDNLKMGVENLSGIDISDVKVHYNSAQPAQLNAHAYAQGNQIHVAPGQEKHLAHEAWHVVQQKQGRVKPTKQLKSSLALNDEPGLEKEADVMGAKALSLNSGTAQTKKSLKKSDVAQTVIQGKLTFVTYKTEQDKIEKAVEDAHIAGQAFLDHPMNKGETEARIKVSIAAIQKVYDNNQEDYTFEKRIRTQAIEAINELKRRYLAPAHGPEAEASASAADFEDDHIAAEHEQPRHEAEEEHSEVHSVTRSKTARPQLANERDLLTDTETLLSGKRRVTDKTLIDTTYDSIGQNLVLDLNMLFEEHLQRAIEHGPSFLADIRKIVKLIHDKLNIRSVATSKDKPEKEQDFRKDRIDWVEKHLTAIYGSEVTIKFLREHNWNLSDIQTPSRPADGEQSRMTAGYIKLLKMLDTQLPYFGGSVEYDKNQRNSLEYWIYHLSSLTKDPDRQYPIAQGMGPHALMKPMIDYRTHPGSMLPAQNQRNLGTGIVEAAWKELPESMQRMLGQKTLDMEAQYDFRKPSVRIHDPHQSASQLFGGHQLLQRIITAKLKSGKLVINKRQDATSEEIALETFKNLWQLCSEDEKKTIYGDVLGVPWSDAHLHDGHGFEQTVDSSVLAYGGDFGTKKHPYRSQQGLMNVVGVKGNILETPQVAAAKYKKELIAHFTKKGVAGGHVPDSAFPDVAQRGIAHDASVFAEQFQEKHQAWYDNVRASHKPIIGGMSGHTLGYLNLYEEALRNTPESERANYPSMETLRACMLGALVGDKQHHSYDEVMAASHGFPTYKGSGTLKYEDKHGYGDVLFSGNTAIKNAALQAYSETYNAITTPEPNSVLLLLKKNVYKNGFESHYKALLDSIRAYLISGLHAGNAKDIIQNIEGAVKLARTHQILPSEFVAKPKSREVTGKIGQK
ncbi:MAG TPA: DUF4157 domain-containing protein [Bacteroidia bacterium]